MTHERCVPSKKGVGMNKGIYCLILYLNEPQDISIGSMGMQHFRKGYYCYV